MLGEEKLLCKRFLRLDMGLMNLIDSIYRTTDADRKGRKRRRVAAETILKHILNENFSVCMVMIHDKLKIHGIGFDDI